MIRLIADLTKKDTMKTAEEWLKEVKGNPITGGYLFPEDIEEIQLDAWKQGMTDAVGICDSQASASLASFHIKSIRDDKKSL